MTTIMAPPIFAVMEPVKRVEHRDSSLKKMLNSISSIIRKQKVILTSGAVAVGTVLLLIAVEFLYSPLQQESLLSITFHASQTGSVALYYDTGMRFQERESQSIAIQGDSTWHTFIFPLPNKKINALRFDPPAVKDAEFQIRDIRIINSRGTTLRRIELEDVKPLHQIRHFERSDRVIRFQTDEISNDPQLLILPEHTIRFAWYHVLRGTFLLWLLIAGLGTFIVLLLTFHTFRSERTRNLPKIATLFVLTIPCLWGVWFLHAKVSSCFLEASIKTTSAEMAKLYFDTGQGLTEGQTAALWINSIDSFGQYRFPLPHETIYHLRIDPPSTDGTVIIKKVLVTDGLGRIIRYIPLHQLYPINQIEKSILQGDHLAITSIRNATDPQIGIHLQNPLQIPTALFWGDPLFLTIILALWAMNLLLFKVFKKILYLVSLVGAMLAGGIPGRLIIWIHNVLQKTVDYFSHAERKNKTLWKFLLTIGIFLGFFLFFFLRNHYYVPAKLHIEGFAQKPAAAIFQWDTGNGLNDLEATAFTVESKKLLEKIPHRVVIERTGEKHLSAQAAEVRVLSIATDQQDSLKLASFAVPRVIDVRENGAIVLLQDQARITFTETFQKITIKFLKNSWSGKVRIFIDDARHGEYDLYAEQVMDTSITIEKLPKPELFVRELELPQLGVYGIALKTKDQADMFSLHALKIVSANGEVKLPVNSGVVSNAFVYPQIDPQTAKFHWTLFTVQIILAGLCTYFVIRLFPYVCSRQQLRVTFLTGKRPYFWGMFIIAVCVYSLWLLGLWPGGMSNDSLNCWLQTISLSFDDWHPYLYSIFILMLKQFYPNPAIVGICQIIFTALLGSAVFYYCVKKIHALYIFPFYMGFILSIPIGLYNTVIWKDIPFSLAVVAMSFFLFKHAIENRASLRPPRINYVCMTLILIAILQFRHNGVLYYALLPILFCVIFPRTIWIRLSMIVIGIFIVSRFMLPSVLHIQLANQYPPMEIGTKLGSMIWIMSDPRYVSQDKSKDLETMSWFMPWEEMKRNCDPCVSAMLIVHPKFANNGYPPEKILEFRQLYRHLVIQNPQIFLAERTYQFFCHLGCGYEGTYSSNLQSRNLLGSVHLYNLIFHPRSQFLNRTLTAYGEWSLRCTGLLSPRNLIWNITIPITLLITMLLITGIRHPLSLLLLPTLVMVAALFFVTQGIEFRYFYFAYLLSIFLIPLCIVCKKVPSKTGLRYKIFSK